MWDDAVSVSIRVVLAEDSYIVREGLEQVLETGARGGGRRRHASISTPCSRRSSPSVPMWS